MDRYGTILVDPPWSYQKTTRHEKLSGYSDVEYRALTTADLAALPVGALASPDAVLLLWCCFPFLRDGLDLVEAWGFDYVTAFPWVKIGESTQDSLDGTALIPLQYGVGYWFRGAAEFILVGKRGRAYRTNHTGILAPGMKHSRKPKDIYLLAETGDAPFPAPRIELFARVRRNGWDQLGNELDGDGQDIRVSLPALVAAKGWAQ